MYLRFLVLTKKKKLKNIQKKQSKILTAVKSGIIYEGDLELMTALHNFTEESLEQTKETLANIKKELEELEPVNGE